MRDVVLAEDGDEVSVVTTATSLQQAIIQVEIENKGFDFAEIFSLTPVRARALAQSLLTAADVVERFALDDEDPLSRNNFTSLLGHPGYSARFFFEQDNTPGP